MIKKSIKYLLIVGINFTLLTSLLLYWTDFIELTFNSSVRLIEFLNILGVSMLSLIGIRIGIQFFRKLSVSINSRIQISILITLIISSILYYNYFIKVYENRIQYSDAREQLSMKIKPTNGLAFGHKADNLTYEEYYEITKMKWFPKLQKDATKISYHYTYDGFLPDYSFNVSYSLPLNAEIDSTEFKSGSIQITKGETEKRVNYNEYRD